jgi:hypothetical protein
VPKYNAAEPEFQRENGISQRKENSEELTYIDRGAPPRNLRRDQGTVAQSPVTNASDQAANWSTTNEVAQRKKPQRENSTPAAYEKRVHFYGTSKKRAAAQGSL